MERKKQKSVTEDQEGVVRWKKIGGGSFRTRQGKIIKQNQTFFAHPDDIPKAFRDTVIPLEAPLDGPDTPLTSKAPGYSIVVKNAGWYNVVSSTGKVMNEKGLRRDAAEEYLEALS